MSKSISQLTAITSLTSTDLFHVSRLGTDKKITFANFLASVSASIDLETVLTAGNSTGGLAILSPDGDSSLSVIDGTITAEYNDGGGTVSKLITSAALAQLSYTDGAATGIFAIDDTGASLEHTALVDIDAPIIQITTDSGAFGEAWIYGDNASISFGFGSDEGFGTTGTETFVLHNGLKSVRVTDTEMTLTHGVIIDVTAPVEMTLLTASTVPYLDASKVWTSSAVTPTELGYVSGASSNLQAQIDALVSGLSWKQAVRVATTGAGTLATSFENGDTVDGVVLSTGDRILIKNQASATENGIYTVNASGAPTRSLDMNSGSEFPSATVAVSEGTTNADTQWVCNNNAPVTIGVTNISFVAVGGTTYVGTTNRISVTGNVIDIDSNYVGQASITTVGTITTGVWNAGAVTSSGAITGTSHVITGTGGAGFFECLEQASAPSTPTNAIRIFADSSNRLSWKGENGFVRTFDGTANSADRAYTLPDRSGTVALTDTQTFTLTFTPGALSPADGTTYYFSFGIIAPSTTAAAHDFNLGYAFTITEALIISSSNSTAGTTENSTAQIRNVTQASSHSMGTFQTHGDTTFIIPTTLTGLNISVAAGDFICFQWDTPTWVTNPVAARVTVILTCRRNP